MKPLMERKFWKIMLGIIFGIGFISVILFVICLFSASETNQRRSMEYEKAKEAGFDKVYCICSRGKELTLDGIPYILYTARWSSFVDGVSEEEVLVRKDATYIDETEGKTEGLAIYCRESGYVNDSDDPVTYDSSKYMVLEPYKIAIYRQGVDTWAVAGILVLVGLIEIILVAVLVIYFVMYYVRKNKNPA